MANIYDLVDTWNEGATVFTAIKMDVTDTASAAGSLLLDLKVGGVSKFSVDKTGAVTGGDATNWNTAYTYSQVGHLPLAGGTLTGGLNGTTGIFSGAITQEGNTVLDTADIGVSVQAYDADTAKLDVAQSWTAAQRGASQTASITGATTLDFATYQNFVLTLTGNVTLDNPTTEVVGQSGFIVFIQDGTGSRTVSLGTDYETAGGAGLTLSTAASTTDIVPYIVAASGRILLGTPQLAFA